MSDVESRPGEDTPYDEHDEHHRLRELERALLLRRRESDQGWDLLEHLPDHCGGHVDPAPRARQVRGIVGVDRHPDDNEGSSILSG